MTPAVATTDSVVSRFGVYLKGEPKALGAVQIIIGIMTLLFGIVLIAVTISPAIVSGITEWGSLIYISSGSLTVAAANHKNPCVVKASLVMNVFCAVTAGIALILFSVDMVLGEFFIRWCYYYYDSYYSNYRCDPSTPIMWRGIYGVLLVFSLLQFIISISISAFACKATCCSTPTQVYLQPMNLQSVNLQPMYSQPMYSQAIIPQPMNPPHLNPPPMYNPDFFNPQVSHGTGKV